jgi:hypothetical protein
MTLFGMINWTFTWLKDEGPIRYADMAPVVADLFLNGVGAVRPLVGNGSAAGAARRAGRGARRPLAQAA